jgi:hypothetical protein
MRLLRHLPGSFRATAVGLFAVCAASTATALTPFDLNMDRVKVTKFGGSLSDSNTYFVPTVNLMVSAYSNIWSQKKNSLSGANAQAHAKVYVKGLDKGLVQGLSKNIYDDLVAKMRAAGYTVLTYDDLKTHPEVTGHGRDAPESKWGLPTTSEDPNTFIIAAPSDEQAFARGITGPAAWIKSLAKEKNLIAIVPDYFFVVPIAYGQGEVGYKRAEASVAVNPGMQLYKAMIYGMTPKSGTPAIQVQTHGKRLASESAGVVTKLSDDKTSFTSSWNRSSADYLFTLDQQAFSDGILRVSYALNTMIVSEIKKGHK